ncbi:MAG: hypothetical protein ACTHM1_12395 [Solirubrobacteraceae bacterium]
MAASPHITYADSDGRARELVLCPGAFGSLLVVDRDSATRGDRRLLAHISADEPLDNAELVCRLYLQEPSRRPGRPLVPEDFQRAPLAAPGQSSHGQGGREPADGQIVNRRQTFCIRAHRGRDEGLPELRWSLRTDDRPDEPWAPITLRETVAALESYEPMCALSANALIRHEGDPTISTEVLRRELTRLRESALVLNRGLRDAVVDAVERRGVVSMSELALRCGMVKRDRRGTFVGDTTWLARRVGLIPDGGRRKPTRWIHSDVLALIARHGLGVSPREVELE